jgi:polyhydroxyalkanoate synthesis repressor PhaR
MSDVRIIKKYPNRRLYDTEISRYITLEEVRQLVLGNTRFQVQDKNSGEDITRSIMLQVIAEQEEGGNPIFTPELLSHIIRFYGDPMQHSISRYLELSMQLFVQKQHQFSDQLKQLLGQAQHPVQTLRELAEHNVPIWRSVRKEFLKNLTRAKTTLRGRRRGSAEASLNAAEASED